MISVLRFSVCGYAAAQQPDHVYQPVSDLYVHVLESSVLTCLVSAFDILLKLSLLLQTQCFPGSLCVFISPSWVSPAPAGALLVLDGNGLSQDRAELLPTW